MTEIMIKLYFQDEIVTLKITNMNLMKEEQYKLSLQLQIFGQDECYYYSNNYNNHFQHYLSKLSFGLLRIAQFTNNGTYQIYHNYIIIYLLQFSINVIIN